jgi:hypothetical protein
MEVTGADLRDNVGTHIVTAVATDLTGRQVLYALSYRIEDVNECTVPPSHPMRHK